jgi:hypothetical protein
MKLCSELEMLKSTTPKPTAKDDFIDALRFAVTRVPWDFSVLNKRQPPKKDKHAGLSQRERIRLGIKDDDEEDDGLDLIEAEMDLFNEALDYDFGEDD